MIAISSNAIIARLQDAPAAPGDEAVFIGAQGSVAFAAADLAQSTARNVYNLVMELSAALPRIPV